ncbi:hypothetical protein [Acinetobacter lanii]|uniref:hypothetical protein n=1 Tax=Acinetobacter lanii TaxID=2715163 RepID=UPI0018C8A49A|nr:hypothetical protein [Acinetobacter lanii]
MSDASTSTKKSVWRSPWVYVAVILSCLFLAFFYLAVTNEPDYMPSQDAKNGHNMNHGSGQSAAEMGMTEEEHANMDQPTAAEMNMTEEEHANMDKAAVASEAKAQ